MSSSLLLNFLCLNASSNSFSIIDYNTDSLKSCFIYGYLLIPAYLVFSIVNGYIWGSSSDLTRHYKHKTISSLRYLSSFIYIIILLDLFIKYFTNIDGAKGVNLFASYLITDLYKLFSFSLHTIIIFNKNIFNHYPICLFVSFVCLTGANVISFVNHLYIVRLKQNKWTEYDKYNLVLLSLYNLLLVVYMLVVVFTNITDKCRVKHRSIPPEEIDPNKEPEAKLEFFDNMDNTEDSIPIPTKAESNSEEDMANYYSYLTFKWLKPLLTKGYNRQIRSIENLCRLPVDLNINRICDRFMSKYLNNNDHFNTNPIVNPELLVDFNFMENSNKYEDIDNVQIREPYVSANNLISSLLRCFGNKYFILGLFKLASDVLNFAGPLLLNQLVQFVELKDSASLRDGIIYASLLFFSTLISSMLNIHFTNSLNKLTLKIRTSLIGLIYRKAVVVKLNELSKYSIGKIVNYMSIDSDSIVNAFPSFHSFWSLPIQIAITLYLLYSQIGISFLVGVAFVIILIPINKILSDYIGKVQKRLMIHKDERVKVSLLFLLCKKLGEFQADPSFRIFLRQVLRNNF